jgi:uncharacterized membrane protein
MTMTISRDRMWEITSRTIVYAAIGAALYAIFGAFQFVIPGTQNVAIRPSVGIVTFFGFAFGPIVGLFTGLVGNMLIDTFWWGSGPVQFWNWSLANGLVGLVAGLAPYYLPESLLEGTRRYIGAAIAAAVGTIVGMFFVMTDVWYQGQSAETVFSTGYIPAITTNLIAVIIITPILVAIWDPLSRQLGR